MEFFLILIFIGVGCMLVIKTQWIYDFTGEIEWAEQHFGGTLMFIKVIGIVIILGSLLWITGGVQAILTAIFSPLIGSL